MISCELEGIGTRAALSVALEPLCVSAIGIGFFGYALQLLILKEAPTAYQCVGSAVIVCACAAHTLLDTKKAH